MNQIWDCKKSKNGEEQKAQGNHRCRGIPRSRLYHHWRGKGIYLKLHEIIMVSDSGVAMRDKGGYDSLLSVYWNLNFFRIAIFLPFLDYFIDLINERLLKHTKLLECSARLLPDNTDSHGNSKQHYQMQHLVKKIPGRCPLHWTCSTEVVLCLKHVEITKNSCLNINGSIILSNGS